MARNSGMSLLAALGLGAGAMYLLDADKGRRRRAIARDKLISVLTEAQEGFDCALNNLRDKARGVVAESRHLFSADDASDDVLEARVRAKLGRVVSHPHAVHTTVRDGVLTLSGDIFVHELPRLLAAARRVRGIQQVKNELQAHESSAQVPSLQGSGRRSYPEPFQENWSPALRLLAGSVGSSLMVGRRGGLLSPLVTLGGAGLFLRAVTNMPIRRLVGVGAGRRAIDLHKNLTINAPSDEVFDYWSNFENFPKFMSHLRSVRMIDEMRSRWVAVGPFGLSLEWDAEITRLDPGKLIAWRSEPGSALPNAGVVRFEAIEGDGTRLDIKMSYNPPAGAIGHVLLSILGNHPKRAMDRDLLRLKTLLEVGKATARGREIELRDLEVGNM